MKCPNCQNEIADGLSRCTYCSQEIKVAPVSAEAKPKKNKWSSLVIILIFIAVGAYNSIANIGVQKNESGIDLLDKGQNYEQAIESFAEAYKNVKNDEDRVTILKNWAYACWTNNQLAEAKQKFIEALALVKSDTADYYLITGEIALLNNNPKTAEDNYLQAIALEPDNFQINTTLGVFYMGIDEINQNFTDYNKAIIYTQKAYEVKPNSEMVKENLASNYFYLGEYQKALDLFKLTSLDNKAYNNYMLGLCYLGLEDLENAKVYIQTSMDMGFMAEPEVLNYLGLEIAVD